MNAEGDGATEIARGEDRVRGREASGASHFRSINITGVRLRVNRDYRRWSELNLVEDREKQAMSIEQW